MSKVIITKNGIEVIDGTLRVIDKNGIEIVDKNKEKR